MTGQNKDRDQIILEHILEEDVDHASSHLGPFERIKSFFKKQPIFYWPSPKKNKIGIGKFVEKNIDGYEISKKLQDSYIYKLDDGRPQVITQDSEIQVKTLNEQIALLQKNIDNNNTEIMVLGFCITISVLSLFTMNLP